MSGLDAQHCLFRAIDVECSVLSKQHWGMWSLHIFFLDCSAGFLTSLLIASTSGSYLPRTSCQRGQVATTRSTTVELVATTRTASFVYFQSLFLLSETTLYSI